MIKGRDDIVEIKAGSNLRVEMEIPIKSVENFNVCWKPNQHVLLEMSGYMEPEVRYRQRGDSKIALWMEKDGTEQTIFRGYVVKAEQYMVGNLKKILLKAKSATCKLDCRTESKSYQAVEESYAEIIQRVIAHVGGNVICNRGREDVISRPVIQYQETAWEFCKRLASHLGTCVIPDPEAEEAGFWFGMRKGTRFDSPSEDEYVIGLRKKDYENSMEIRYEMQSREYHKVGDQTICFGQKMIISEANAIFKHGELVYYYILKQSEECKMIYQDRFIGLGLEGTVEETKEEKVRLALDIDNGSPTGSYFYDWCPETGNSFYAMPEKGARVLLYFGSNDERDGFALHCLPKSKNENYQDRYCKTINGSSMELFREKIHFAKGTDCRLNLTDDSITAVSTQELNISAKKNIQIEADSIIIYTPDELSLCQG